jgi:hypothetical protein
MALQLKTMAKLEDDIRDTAVRTDPPYTMSYSMP